MHELSSEVCVHCEAQEDPSVPLRCGCVLTTALDDDNVTLCPEHSRELERLETEQMIHEALLSSTQAVLKNLSRLRANLLHGR